MAEEKDVEMQSEQGDVQILESSFDESLEVEDDTQANVELELENSEEASSDPDEVVKDQENIKLLNERRQIVLDLLEQYKVIAKEGDKVYIIPKFWYDNFFNEDVTDPELLGPIDTTLICRDYDNFFLKDYDDCPYISVPESIFLQLVEWHGLSSNSEPVQTNLVLDEATNTLITEYNKLFYRVQYLIDPNEKPYTRNTRNANNINFFTISTLSTLTEAANKALNIFFELESNLNIDSTSVRIWLATTSMEESIHKSNYLLGPIDFLSYQPKIHVTKDLFGKQLRDLSTTGGNFIIEVKQIDKNYHWVSNYFKYNDFHHAKGTMGLSNLGNTCYMNSALQCLVHIPQLRDYFLYSAYEAELNTDNLIGYKGYVAKAFSSLVQNLFGDTITKQGTNSSFGPNHFKSTVGHFNSMFSGYLQQDSQEFLAFLLDSLHEDLNRIINKPSTEKPSLKEGDDYNDPAVIKSLADETWKMHLLRNDSVITDLFVGMYKSTLECPECTNVSITFDPYSDLTLPLPVDSTWSSKVRIFPQNSPPCILEIELSKNSTYQDLKNYVAKCAQMDSEDLYGCEVFSYQFYNNFESAESNSQFLPLKDLISESDVVVFYELPRTAEDDVIVPILNTRIEEGFNKSHLFGVPFFIVLSQEELNNPTLIRNKLEKLFINLSGGFIQFPSTCVETPERSLDMFPLLSEKYSEVALATSKGYIEEVLKYATPNVVDAIDFFEVKILQDVNEKLRLESEDGKFWTPQSHMNLNKIKAISTFVSPIIADIYNYRTISSNTAKEPTDEEAKNENKEVEEEEQEEENDEEEQQKENLADVLRSHSLIVCEWSLESSRLAFSEEKVINWENPGVLQNVELEELKTQREVDGSDKEITLNDCLNLFSKREVLGLNDSWYCPHCKEHRQASKRIQLWNTPDVLLIHLKRFENQRSFSDKIDATVNFPIENLDMSPYLVHKDDPRGTVYDLYAVDNHYGGLGGGHYTAYVKNFIDNKWYYFDDSRVYETDPEKSVSGSAYLLFYLRRGSNESGGSEQLRELIKKSRFEHEQKIKEIKDKQEELYETSKTSEEDNEDEDEDEDEDEYEDAIEEAEDQASLVNRDSFKTVLVDKEHSNESFEIRHMNDDDGSGRRKMRLLNKIYKTESLTKSESTSPILLSPTEPGNVTDKNSLPSDKSE
ncbi:hypothetical protein KAFR_0F01560 [Kazachstania africana CBS 2517]|uniref:ubiquitinyl hydrolase 1 n=1 Tax=Kazachstania africana (strain ATCC 22294 / BCRC 22015 / CBS 2517 / CECT 1963 / NBRC 1671 / NRRL Y-8276) TaxID=1071382 RepID=H2AWK3_KAZAF|nr:hypothetical protein KAFR_0F01560 [Kazachstania africana CBS 2517]CCF58753.1 hypothetical protein KAFR_0F01560 [Kazachstania africana CBS 2517]